MVDKELEDIFGMTEEEAGTLNEKQMLLFDNLIAEIDYSEYPILKIRDKAVYKKNFNALLKNDMKKQEIINVVKWEIRGKSLQKTAVKRKK